MIIENPQSRKTRLFILIYKLSRQPCPHSNKPFVFVPSTALINGHGSSTNSMPLTRIKAETHARSARVFVGNFPSRAPFTDMPASQPQI